MEAFFCLGQLLKERSPWMVCLKKEISIGLVGGLRALRWRNGGLSLSIVLWLRLLGIYLSF